MGNEILPRVPPIGKKNIFHCQFPFKYHFEEIGFQMSQVDYYNGYDCILVNSEFTRFNIQKQQREYSLKDLPVQIAYPPVGEFMTGSISDLINKKENKTVTGLNPCKYIILFPHIKKDLNGPIFPIFIIILTKV